MTLSYPPRALTPLRRRVYTVAYGRKRPCQAPVAEWYTRQVEGLCPKGRGGSSPLGGTSITARRAQELPAISSRTSRCFRARAASSVGRASALHAECQGFESLAAHPMTLRTGPCRGSHAT